VRNTYVVKHVVVRMMIPRLDGISFFADVFDNRLNTTDAACVLLMKLLRLYLVVCVETLNVECQIFEWKAYCERNAACVHDGLIK